jgi:hypothetical protein
MQKNIQEYKSEKYIHKHWRLVKTWRLAKTRRMLKTRRMVKTWRMLKTRCPQNLWRLVNISVHRNVGAAGKVGGATGERLTV